MLIANEDDYQLTLRLRGAGRLRVRILIDPREPGARVRAVDCAARLTALRDELVRRGCLEAAPFILRQGGKAAADDRLFDGIFAAAEVVMQTAERAFERGAAVSFSVEGAEGAGSQGAPGAGKVQ